MKETESTLSIILGALALVLIFVLLWTLEAMV